MMSVTSRVYQVGRIGRSRERDDECNDACNDACVSGGSYRAHQGGASLVAARSGAAKERLSQLTNGIS